MSEPKYIKETIRARQQAQRIYNRVDKGKVKCKCGGKCCVQILTSRGCSMRQQIRFYCSRSTDRGRKACHLSSEWHDDHDTMLAWQEWQQSQRR